MSMTLVSRALVVALLCLVVATHAQQGRTPVLDTDGRPLRAGTQYYILPKTPAAGAGGLTLIPQNRTCPLYVGQQGPSGSTGLPVLFRPFATGEKIVRENSDFTLGFVGSTICVQSSSDWKIDFESSPDFTQRKFITTTTRGSQRGSYMRISRNGDGYKLGYCPVDVCPLCRFACGDAGIVVENGKRLFVLYAPALPVVFKRA